MLSITIPLVPPASVAVPTVVVAEDMEPLVTLKDMIHPAAAGQEMGEIVFPLLVTLRKIQSVAVPVL